MQSGETSIYTIYAHRGNEVDRYGENSIQACLSAKRSGFGIEVDLRQKFGEIYLSHDQNLNSVRENLQEISNLNISSALNLKEDGLLPIIKKIYDFNLGQHSFVFDGSMPEMYRAARMNIPHALRLSEYEMDLAWTSDYLWLDGFEKDWWLNNDSINNLFKTRKLVVVSPELHGRDFEQVWVHLKQLVGLSDNWFGICTDLAEDFRHFFEEQND